MFWLYVGWRVLRRVRVVLLAAVLAGVVLIGHPQTQLRQALDGRGVVGARVHQLGHQLQHGLEQHLRPFRRTFNTPPARCRAEREPLMPRTGPQSRSQHPVIVGVLS